MPQRNQAAIASRMTQVLVVDDDPEILDVVAQLLITEGYEVHTAANGLEALAQIRKNPPDVILLDSNMPVLDGPGMLQRLRKEDPALAEIPTILCSGSVHLSSSALELGLSFTLDKPSMPEALLEVVARAAAYNK